MRGAAAALALLAFTACQSPLESCESGPSMLGAWNYSGLQDAPASAVLTGTLEITSESCVNFQGRLDLVQVEPFGTSRRYAGPLSGRAVGNAVRFDVWLAAIPRQHIASLGADSAAGSWAAVGGALSETGTFSVSRRPVR